MSQRPAFPTAFVSLAKIMLALFLFLNTLSSRDLAREKAALAALQQTFRHTGRDIAFDGEAPAAPPAARAGLSDMRNMLVLNRLRFTEDPSSLTITLMRRDLFTPGARDIQERLGSAIKNIARTAGAHGLDVTIAAHSALADSSADDPVADWRESLLDADAVYRFFIDAGSDTHRLWASGTGGSEPVMPNDTPEHRADNQRVVLTIRAHAS